MKLIIVYGQKYLIKLKRIRLILWLIFWQLPASLILSQDGASKQSKGGLINVITSIKKLLKVWLCYCSMNSVEIAGMLIIQMKIVVHRLQVIQPLFRWERVDLHFVKNEFSWLSVQLFINSFLMSSNIYQFSYLSFTEYEVKF